MTAAASTGDPNAPTRSRKARASTTAIAIGVIVARRPEKSALPAAVPVSSTLDPGSAERVVHALTQGLDRLLLGGQPGSGNGTETTAVEPLLATSTVTGP